jgi:glucosamine-6-phosphate deaminase
MSLILATGTSQFQTLKYLIADNSIDWSKVVMFHLDEYIGLPITHRASFRKYLQERFLSKVPPLKGAHLVNGEKPAKAECQRLGHLITDHPIDVALVGIGENGHLAFNDPPADFETTDPYIVVNLDAACRAQQFGEGWFKSIDEVPLQAISMSVQQILKSKHIICSVPDERKAVAVKNCIEHPVSNLYPASVLKNHKACILFLDEASARALKRDKLQQVSG